MRSERVLLAQRGYERVMAVEGSSKEAADQVIRELGLRLGLRGADTRGGIRRGEMGDGHGLWKGVVDARLARGQVPALGLGGRRAFPSQL